jgi:hypothetical protein
MVDREEPQPLIPQYSIRWMLAVTAVCAVVFSVMGLAVRGHHWALGVSIAVRAVGGMMVVNAAIFGLVWIFSLVRRKRCLSPFPDLKRR